MASGDLWKLLCNAFPYIPKPWEITVGDETEEAYQHGTSILGLSFSPDDSLLALAGGGCIPHVDGSIRLIDVATRKNVRTLRAHVCGVHDVSFDLQSGLLATASYDYAVHLWNLDAGDVIALLGSDDKTKGYSKFTREGSLLAIGEYAYYDGPHSIHLYDLKSQKKVFEYALPDEMGVGAMALSADSKYLAVVACDRDETTKPRLLVVQLGPFTVQVVKEHVFEGFQFFDLAFVGGNDRLVGGICDDSSGDFESGLIEIDVSSGEIGWSEQLGGIGVEIACHPDGSEIAVGYEGSLIRFYDPNGWQLLREHRFKADEEEGNICSLAYSNRGDLLAYGRSNCKFGILTLPAGDTPKDAAR
jgi:WD40 repeat protein